MYPELFTIRLPVVGELTITSFGAMMALAFLTGYVVVLLELRRRDMQVEIASDILLGALVGGIVGAKLYYVLLYWERTAADPFGMLFDRGGLVWYGGLIGGVLGVLLVLRLRKVDVWQATDVAAPALALSYAVGRIGCFLVGDDYGRHTDSWVGVAFPRGMPPSTAGNLRRWGMEVDPSIPDTQVLAVHPTQLYETGLSLIIFLILWRLRRHPHLAGWLFGLWLIFAGMERFIVEIFRAKDDRFLGAFTIAQLFSLLALGLGVHIVRSRMRRPEPVS